MDIAHVEPIEPLLCAHCASRPATRFLEPDSAHDETCEECFISLYDPCGHCGEMAPKVDLNCQQYLCDRCWNNFDAD